MKLRVTKVFHRNYKSKKRYVINRWGTRSSKTYSLAQLFAMWLYSWFIEEGGKHYEEGVLSIVRKHSTTLKATAMRDFEKAIDDLWIRNQVEINKTEKTYIYEGRMVEFFGADNEQKLRGGTRKILYCNEANELQWETEFFQLMIRTEDKIFIDFNPDNEDIWINTEIEQKRALEVWDVEVIISTYKDNPFLPVWLVQEIERLAETNPAYWRIYWLWEYGKLEGIIFPWIEVIDEIPEEAKLIAYWLDFGFTNDPTSLVAIYKRNKQIIMHELLYETGLTNKDIADRMDTMELNKEMIIYADSSEPKSIEEICQLWWIVKPVTKWPDSIMFGINIMLQHKLLITAVSSNGRKEVRGYVWSKDKNGKHINKPLDINNHFIDAARYAMMMTLWQEETFNLFIW